jgi:quercetin dioxygenase-like cupin family protein
MSASGGATEAAAVAVPAWFGSSPLIRSSGAADARWDVDVLWLMLVRGSDTGGRWSLMDQLCRKGSGPPPHSHVWSDQMLYVIEGEVTFLVGDEVRTGGAGTLVYVPRDTRHGFRVDSDVARILNGYTPASWEAAIERMSASAAARELPPSGFKPQSDVDPMEVMRAYGMEPIKGPDPLRR